MNRFARLIERLTHERRTELRLLWLADYFRAVEDSERGFALALLTGNLRLPRINRDWIADLAEARCDPKLWRISVDYVGDPIEALALCWPERAGANRVPGLADLANETRLTLPRVEAYLDALDADGRFALLRLCTGSLRVSVHARLAKEAVAGLGNKKLAELEAVWPSFEPPYIPLFAWLEGRGAPAARAPMRPMMQTVLAPIDDARGYFAEWKWDGRRVQLIREAGMVRLFTSSGEDLAGRFPRLAKGIMEDVAIDAVLAPHDATRATARLHAFDLPDHADRPIEERRARLETLLEDWRPPAIQFSAPIDATDPERAPEGADGVILKLSGSPYVAGRDHRHWLERPRRPREADLVLMYARDGAELTFGAWRGEDLLPVGKAHAAADLMPQFEAFMRGHVAERIGPVLIFERKLVARIAYDHADSSRRHKSGLCLRDARVLHLRPDLAPGDAARVELHQGRPHLI